MENKNVSITEEDVDMAKYILSILSTNKPVIMSWGFHKAKAIQNGIIFNVNGFIHKGQVKVVYNMGVDLFDITLLNNKNEVTREIHLVYFDELIEIIDNAVEKVENYEQAVKDFYKCDLDA
jgi:hypothetical protein